MDRREFLRTSGAAGAGLAIACCISPQTLAGVAVGGPAGDSFSPNAWLQILPSGQIRLWVGRSEMGQGPRTSVAMIMADELEADWSRIEVLQADYGEKFGDQLTGGSFSVRYAWHDLRQPAAAAREMLITAASREWRVPRNQCVAREGAVLHEPSGRRADYGELVSAAATVPVPKDPPLKQPGQFRIIGTDKPRVDGPRIVTGKAVYGIDVRVPGMLYAAVARPAVFGAKVKSYDATKARAVAGVRHVVEVPRVELPIPFERKPGGAGHQHFLWGGVAVVADTFWAALRGRDALQIEWDLGAGATESSTRLREEALALAAQPGNELRKIGDPEAVYAKSAHTLEADYEVPFLAHAPMEPPNCTADVRNGRCELWVPTQNAPAIATALQAALGLPQSAITIHITLLGGGFGRRLNLDYGVEAALVSRGAGATVKVVWTREDDIRHDYYRPVSLHRLRASHDGSKVTAWMHHIVAPCVDGFYEGPDSADASGTQIAGRGAISGTVPNFRLAASYQHTLVPRGWWRSVSNSTNLFVVQGFIDELAAALHKDPLVLRRELIGPPGPAPADAETVDLARLRGVFDLAAEKSGWGKPPAAGRGRGIAGGFGFGSYVAQVAEVSVGKDGAVRVHRVVCAVDCGRVINPDMVRAQMEGGLVFGLSAALHGAITIENGRVQQSNFDEYSPLRMNEMPQVEVHIVESAAAPGGVGEPGVPPIAPAVANAIFAATGKRIRRLPIRPEDLAGG
jgi:isoquinoline 1-oxidoreductase beta subunit